MRDYEMATLMMQIRLLREVLEWGKSIQESMDADDLSSRSKRPRAPSISRPADNNESIVVLVFPEGDFQVVKEGTTAADIIYQKVLLPNPRHACCVPCFPYASSRSGPSPLVWTWLVAYQDVFGLFCCLHGMGDRGAAGPRLGGFSVALGSVQSSICDLDCSSAEH